MGRLRSIVVLAGVLAFGGLLTVTGPGPGVHLVLAASESHTATGFRAVGGTRAAGGQEATAETGLPPGQSWTVTLVTGDVVSVRTVSGGPPLVSVRPGPGRQGVIFSKLVSTSGRIEVLPHDMAPLIGTVLDPALFDVTALIRNGDDDAHRSFIPLIVQGEDGKSGSAAAAALGPGTRADGSLGSINAAALAVPKASAVQQGRALAGMAAAAARADRATPSITGDVRHVWLDHTVWVTGNGAISARQSGSGGPLDRNLVQIGAPAAWQAGDTGRGVTVAVLDTGIDATHPDLAGRVVTAQNFSSSPDTVDRFGHGTFVAAEIAGTGADADGQRRGVASGSRLVIGKVLGDDGMGLESDVIAGMQWAATRARVVNMSLGDSTPSDGTDPLSQAINQLTTADHVLFVVAAGNSGPSDETVGSPAAADDALTVGAVDGRGKLAAFSSRGPRIGDYAIKPEIVAPGVNIAGARAAGTMMGSPLDARYTIASGTSFAAPEVTGAAAILTQLHPGWDPARLRAALVSSAGRATGGDTYELGGGLLDIAAAISDPVLASQDVVGLGAVSGTATQPVTGQLAWTNTSSSPVTLSLSATMTDHAGRPTHQGALTLAANRLTVPPGGSATTTLSADPRLLTSDPGLYEGMVAATDGRHSVHVPVSLYLPPAEHTLTLRATPLPGTAAGDMSASAYIVDTSDPDLFPAAYVPIGADGTATVRVPTGDYWVAGDVDDNTDPSAVRSAMTGQPQVPITGDTTVTLGGAAAVPVTASVAGRATQMELTDLHVERAFAGQTWGLDLIGLDSGSAPQVYAQPSGGVSDGTFGVWGSFRLHSPQGVAGPYVYDLYHAFGGRIPGSLSYPVTPAAQASLAKVDQRFHALDGSTRPVQETRFGLTAVGFIVSGAFDSAPAGSIRTDYLSTESGIAWQDEVSLPVTLQYQDSPRVTDWSIFAPGFTRYVAGSDQTAEWDRQPLRPGPYSATAGPDISGCAPQPSTRSRGDIHVGLVDLQDMPDGYDCLAGFPPWDAVTTRTLRLYDGSSLIGTSDAATADFTVPDTTAVYRLTYDDDTSATVPVSTQTRTTWTFRSAPPTGLGTVRLPLLLVNYDLPLDLGNHPSGDTAVLTIARVAGTPPARVTSFHMWTSLNGRTWQLAPVHHLGGGRYAATLPRAASGQAVSLRVQAADSGGSGIDQAIMAAYHG